MNAERSSIKTVFAVLCLATLLENVGCCDELPVEKIGNLPLPAASRKEEVRADSGFGTPVTASELESEIMSVHMMLTNSGFRTTAWATSIGNGIKDLNDENDRRRLSALYMDMLERISPDSARADQRSRALDNYAQLLDSWESFVFEPRDAERVFGLMCCCLGHYRRAITEGRNAIPRGNLNARDRRRGQRPGRDDATWNFEAGLARFAMAVTNDYLSVAREKNLLGDRYEYWEGRLRKEIGIGLDAAQ